MQDLFDLLLSNKIYMVVAGIVVIGIVIFLMKKVFKMMMIVLVIALAYGAFLYMTEDKPMKLMKEKFTKGKSTIDQLDDATKDIRRETIDKVIDDVDKKLKEASKKSK